MPPVREILRLSELATGRLAFGDARHTAAMHSFFFL